MIKQKNKKTNSVSNEVQKLNDKILELENLSNQLTDKLTRSLADYANLEKRIESQRQMLFTLAVSSIITKMIDVLDDFYLAQEHLKDKGLDIAINKFVSVLKSEGLEEVDAQGKKFDPENMDCVDVADGSQDTVVEIRKKGYILNSQTIRPAQVVVGCESKTKN